MSKPNVPEVSQADFDLKMVYLQERSRKGAVSHKAPALDEDDDEATGSNYDRRRELNFE